MLSVKLDNRKDSVLRVLCLGAHSDDIEIGCGGSIMRIINQYPELEITWIVFSASGERAVEATASARSILQQVKKKEIIIKDFRDGFFPYIGGEIKDFLEQLKLNKSPDLIFTHYRHDLHQDHRLINELTWNTYRDHLILEYEVPKYDGDLGSPNFFISLDEATVRAKIYHILSNFKSQQGRRWFTEDTFRAILRLRGVESNVITKYGEGFYVRKLTL